MTQPASAEAILDALDPEQRQVALALGGPVVVLAGAGTGKTRAITHRIAYGVRTGQHDARRTVGLTFTNRAAGEMTRRLTGLGVTDVRVRTFHSAALRQLRWAWGEAIGGQMPELTASKAGLVASAANRCGVAADPATVRDLASEIEWAKVSQVSPDAYASVAARGDHRAAATGMDPAQTAKVYSAYEQAKTEANRIDFEDVLLLTVAVLEDRADLLTKVRESFRYLTVDEYQDVSGLQQRLLDVWLGTNDNVCVVGDASQTIYSFAGARSEYLINFRGRYPAATEVRLVRSYRCTPQIIQVATELLEQAREPGGPQPLPLRSETADGPAPDVAQYPDEAAEAEGIASQIAALVSAGTAVRDIAILVRINAQTEPVEAALANAGIPYSVRGAQRFFQRPEVRQAVALIRGSARSPSESGPNQVDLGSQTSALLTSMGWQPERPAGAGAVRERWESLAALVSLARDVAARDPGAGLAQLAAELERRAEMQDAPAADGVTVASLHAAKGMEWEVVFLAGLVDGVLPMSHARAAGEVAEERRLLYVGTTRAKRELRMSWAAARLPGGRARSRSRFLDEIAPAGAAPPKRSKRVRRAGPATCRGCGKSLVTAPELTVGRCRTCPPGYDPALLDRLRDWRTQETVRLTAERGNKIPAYVVATDATLEAVAERKPADLTALAAVPGLGPAKLDRYGKALLELVTESGPRPARR